MLNAKRPPARSGPTRPTARELAKVGVDLMDPRSKRMRCISCGHTWTPYQRHGADAYRAYWKCRNGCNWR